MCNTCISYDGYGSGNELEYTYTLVNISMRSDPHVVQAAKQPSCPDHSYRDVHG